MTGEGGQKGFADEILDGDRLSIAARCRSPNLMHRWSPDSVAGSCKTLPTKLNIPTITAAQAVRYKSRQRSATK